MKFAVVSDVHAEQHFDWSQLVFERLGARSQSLDFAACLGDWTTDPHADKWDKYLPPLLEKIKCPLLGCIGNHDEKVIDWLDRFRLPLDYVLFKKNVRCLFADSIHWKHDDLKSDLFFDWLSGQEEHKFIFTHLTPLLHHWTYGMGPNRTEVLLNLCARHKVTACFTGHMHGFDYLRHNGTHFFICGGGGGGRHDNFPVMHRSNFYLLVDTDPFHVTLCQQHRDHEQLFPWEEWRHLTERPAF